MLYTFSFLYREVNQNNNGGTMQNKKITVTFSVFALAFIIAFSDSGFLKSAYALTITDVDITTGSSLIAETSAYIVTLSNSNKEASFVNKQTLVETTVDFSATYPSATLRSLSCFTSGTCFMTAEGVGAGNGTIVRFTTAGITGNYDVNTDTTNGAPSALAGNTMTAVFGTTVFFARVCSASDTDLAIYSIDGTDMVGAPAQNTLCDGSLSTSSQGVLGGLSVTGSNDAPYLGVVIQGSGGSDDIFRSISLIIAPPANSIVCSLTLEGNAFSNSQHIVAYNDQFYLMDKSGSGVTGRIRAIDPIDCSTEVTSNFSTISDSSITGIDVDSFNEVFYIAGEITPTDYVFAVNFTNNILSNTIIAQYETAGNTAGVKYDSFENSVYVSVQSYLRVINFGEGEGGGSTGGIDCQDPEFSYRLICNLPGNGGLVGTSELLNETSTNIGCMVGIIACTQDSEGNFIPNDPNIQTNGIGYLIWVIALATMIGIFWVASRGQLTEIPTFVWFIGAIGVTLVLTVIQWIDPTALIVSVVVVIAFAVAKAKGVLGGGGQLMNESV